MNRPNDDLLTSHAPEAGYAVAATVNGHASLAAANFSAAVATRAVFRKDGDYWTIAYGGKIVWLRDRKGLRYLAQLLPHPGVHVPASDLVGSVNGSALERGSRPQLRGECVIASDLGDAGEVLDAEAQRQYRRRAAELREELEEAERLNDAGRSSRLRQELEFLIDQLAAAVRGRKAASHAERARLAVTKAIKTALEHIAASHPTLGRHLAATVRRGYFCSYTPDPRLPIAWLTTAAALGPRFLGRED